MYSIKIKKTVAMGTRRAPFSNIGRRKKMTNGKNDNTQARIMYCGYGHKRWRSSLNAAAVVHERLWLVVVQGMLERQENTLTWATA